MLRLSVQVTTGKAGKGWRKVRESFPTFRIAPSIYRDVSMVRYGAVGNVEGSILIDIAICGSPVDMSRYRNIERSRHTRKVVMSICRDPIISHPSDPSPSPKGPVKKCHPSRFAETSVPYFLWRPKNFL